MKYFFALGSNNDLSFAELKAVTGNYFSKFPEYLEYNLSRLSKDIAVLESNADFNAIGEIFRSLGGSTRAGVIIENQETFLKQFAKDNDDRIIFGVSNIDVETPYKKAKDDIKKLAKKIKDYFKKQGNSVRYVLPMGDHMELNAAQVVENDMLEKGFEIVFLGKSSEKALVGRTIAIQNYEDFAHRDYDKPAADPEMGMLPPKLARIMVNLSETEYKQTIWDPFCGSGAVLIESLLLGRNALGSDIDKKAIENTEKNISWLMENYSLSPDLTYNVFEMDVKNVKKKTKNKLDDTEIHAVVCEPYMGPPQRKILYEDKAEKLTKAVGEQFKELFYLLEYVASPGLKVVAVVPSYKTTKGWLSVSMNTILSHRWKTLNSKYSGDLHWKRKTSIIKRNIMIFELE